MNYPKVLKGISIYCLVLGIFSIIVSFALLMYGLMQSSVFYTSASILGILGGIFNIARFIIGLKAIDGEYHITTGRTENRPLSSLKFIRTITDQELI